MKAMKAERAEKAKQNLDMKKTAATSILLPEQTSQKTGGKKKCIKSVTRDEIEKYWKLKKMKEEEHLVAALKAAARIKARNLSEEDYRKFEESLRDVIKFANDVDHNNKGLPVGIKDWWTKSNYAYLNEPPITAKRTEGLGRKQATSTYVPQKICSYAPLVPYMPTTAFGVY